MLSLLRCDSTMAAIPTFKLHLDNTLGAFYIGTRQYYFSRRLNSSSLHQEMRLPQCESYPRCVGVLRWNLAQRLFGITSIQVTTYFNHATKDGWKLKTLVRRRIEFAGRSLLTRLLNFQGCYPMVRVISWRLRLAHSPTVLRVLDLFHLVVHCVAFYFYAISNYGNPLVLLSVNWWVFVAFSTSWDQLGYRSIIVSVDIVST